MLQFVVNVEGWPEMADPAQSQAKRMKNILIAKIQLSGETIF
jgi:hypothetical protein